MTIDTCKERRSREREKSLYIIVERYSCSE